MSAGGRIAALALALAVPACQREARTFPDLRLGMPDMGVTEPDPKDLAAYLETLR